MSHQAGSSQAGPSRAGRAKRNSRVAESDSEEEGSPVLEHGRKKRRVIAETQEAQESEDGDGDYDLNELGSDDGTARVKGKGRANGNGHLEDGDDDEDEDGDEEMNGQVNGDEGALAFRPEYDRDPKDNFVAGAIVRIKCKGFMTYDLVEFRPGPHLNMILGPNGTGKSTIAAAIAIGLGFPPKVMGRAHDLKAYVKQGTERAETEIELKGKRGKRNIVVRRRFQRENDTSEWFLNASPSTLKAVRDTVLGMGVQANNLCSFLPQDKVAEFAKMAPVTVLKETMRAAGDPRLSRWHEELCEKGDKVKVLSGALEKDVTKRDNLQSSVDRMAPDVEHYHAREAQEKERDILSVLIHFAEGTVLYNRGTEIKKRRAEARERKNAIKNRQKPFADLQAFHQKRNQQLDKKMTDASGSLGEFTRKYKACQKKVKDANAAREEVDENLAQLKDRIALRERRRKTQVEKIEAARQVLKLPQDEINRDYKQKDAERREVDVKQDELKAKFVALDETYRNEDEQMRQKQSLLAKKTKQHDDLSSLEKQREQDARDFDGSIDFVLNWMADNQMKLEGKIHKPPMISVNMRERGLAAQVEACTTVQQRKTFICENENDYKRLIELLNTPIPPRKNSRGVMQGASTVRINAQIVEVNDASLNPPRPAAPEQLQKLGFEGWAIDFVEAEPAVIAFLNVNCGLHRAAVTRRPAGQINADHVTRCGIYTWTTGGDSNRAAISRYGRKDAQITSVPLPPARAFQRVVNTEAIKVITEEIGQLKRDVRDAEGPLSDKKKKLEEAKDARRVLQQRMEKIADELKKCREQVVKFRRANADIEVAQRELDRIDAEPSKEQERDKLRDEKMRAVKQLWSPINLQAEAWADEVDVLEKQIDLHLQSFQTAANVEAIAAKVDEDDAEAREAQDAFEQAQRDFDENKHQYLKAVNTCRQSLDLLPAELQQEVDNRRPGAVVEDVRAQLEQVINDLELSAGVDPAFIARYNKMKEELDGYAENVRKKEKDLAIVKKQVEKTLGMFNPALDALVGVVSTKFGAAFERVGCSGEVKINRAGDNYADWGINILVSYRDNDSLQLLTGSLQSGGERSLATVTYLMSLSEMARTPFSLVDEINQGMDQRAERNVHNQLVEVTCATDAGQYFLITPKLLTGLRYHKNMKVLIVNNGTWLPDTEDKTQRFGDMLGCLQKHQRVLAAA